MEKSVKKCLFPAAGYGTRFLPATKAMPKEMLPIVNKPLIQYGAEETLNAGIEQIGIITGRGKQAIENHFDKNYELEDQLRGTNKEDLLEKGENKLNKLSVVYTRQKEMKGLGDAVLQGKFLISEGEPFAVLWADDLCSDDVLSDLVNLYEKYGCSIVALEEVSPENTDKYGIIKGKELENGIYSIEDMIEKPDPSSAPSNLAIIGRYILTQDIFSKLENIPLGKGNELQLTDALLKQISDKGVIGYKFKGKRFDCGSISGYIQAQNYFYENNLY